MGLLGGTCGYCKRKTSIVSGAGAVTKYCTNPQCRVVGCAQCFNSTMNMGGRCPRCGNPSANRQPDFSTPATAPVQTSTGPAGGSNPGFAHGLGQALGQGVVEGVGKVAAAPFKAVGALMEENTRHANEVAKIQAEAEADLLRTNPEAHKELRAEKEKANRKAMMFIFGLAIVVLVIPMIWLFVSSGSRHDQAESFLAEHAGTWANGGRELTVTPGGLSLSGGSTLNLADAYWESASATTISFRATGSDVVAGRDTCEGSLTGAGSQLIVQVSGEDPRCQGFTGTWSR